MKTPSLAKSLSNVPGKQESQEKPGKQAAGLVTRSRGQESKELKESAIYPGHHIKNIVYKALSKGMRESLSTHRIIKRGAPQ